MVASTRYFPSIVIATTYLFGLDDLAVPPFFDLFPAPQGDRIGAGQSRRLEESRRVQPQVQLIEIREIRRYRDRLAIAVDVPCRAAVDDVRLAGRPLRGRTVLPAQSIFPRGRVQSRLAVEGLLAGALLPVNRARVIGQRIDARPVDVDGILEGLADRAAVAGAAVGDAA
jgi:hypothetical protein